MKIMFYSSHSSFLCLFIKTKGLSGNLSLWSIIAWKAFGKLEIYSKSTLVILSFFHNEWQLISMWMQYVNVTVPGVKVGYEILKAVYLNMLYFIQNWEHWIWIYLIYYYLFSFSFTIIQEVYVSRKRIKLESVNNYLCL